MTDWIYGRNPVYESLSAGRRKFHRLYTAQGAKEKGRLAEIIGHCRQHGIPHERIPRKKLASFSADNQGVVLEASSYPYCNLLDILHLRTQEPPFILILDTLQDPQNLGTLLRTAEIVGVDGVLLPLRHSADITPAVVNSSSGAVEHLKIARSNLSQAIRYLKKEDIWIVGLETETRELPFRQGFLNGAIAVVVGNEAKGMRPLVRESCDSLIQLPMRGHVESLNAAVAGSVVLYFVWQAREFHH